MKGGFIQVKNKETSSGGGFVIVILLAKMLERSARSCKTLLNKACSNQMPREVSDKDMDSSVSLRCIYCKLDFFNHHILPEDGDNIPLNLVV